VLGVLSRDFVPVIKQAVIIRASGSAPFESTSALENALYETRRLIQGQFRVNKFDEAYVCSLSSRTIVYKGMLRSCDLPRSMKRKRGPA